MEAALRNRLLAVTGLAALLAVEGWTAEQLVTFGQAAQGAPPKRIVMHRISGASDASMDGASGLVESRVQLDFWGARPADCWAMASLVAGELSGTSFVQDGVEFQRVTVEMRRDDFDGEPPNRLYRTLLELRLWHDEA